MCQFIKFAWLVEQILPSVHMGIFCHAVLLRSQPDCCFDSRIFSPVAQIKSHSLLSHVSYKTGMLVKGENQTPYGDLFHKNTTS